jgi:hypothetical protein
MPAVFRFFRLDGTDATQVTAANDKQRFIGRFVQKGSEPSPRSVDWASPSYVIGGGRRKMVGDLSVQYEND